MKESNPESPASVSTRECVVAGLRRSSKCSYHRPIMSPVEGKRDWKPLEEHSCTDIPWLIIFTLFCIGMVLRLIAG
ncbi:hypothetical protein ILYODFUR_036272 [Ilyodon furcidens]|uniref:Stress-associated endoplasmic reticulum protein n=1 Tax=Ilyodon furcidens TaxID=33524 RepID=A0ABV0TRI2_9TELE